MLRLFSSLEGLIFHLQASDLGPKIQLLAFQQIDIDSIVYSMVRYVVRLYEESAPIDDILESAFIVALSLYKQACE